MAAKKETAKAMDMSKGKADAEAAMTMLGGSDDHPYQIGSNVYVRTVTFHHVGTLIRVTDKELVLTNASWIPDSGRWMQCMQTGEMAEVEPCIHADGTPMIITLPRDGSSTFPIRWPLPTAQK